MIMLFFWFISIKQHEYFYFVVDRGMMYFDVHFLHDKDFSSYFYYSENPEQIVKIWILGILWRRWEYGFLYRIIWALLSEIIDCTTLNIIISWWSFN